MKIFVLSIFLGFSTNARALTLQASPRASAGEQAYLSQLIAKLDPHLPAPLRHGLSQGLVVRVAPASKAGDRIHLGMASYRKNEIILNSEFMAGAPGFTEAKALRTLLHEVGHFYDFANIESEKIKRQRASCADETKFDVHTSDGVVTEPSALCQSLAAKTTSISQDPEFRALTYWQDGILEKNANNFQRRLTDPYEATSSKEAFAVLLEKFIFDPDFKCRKPALNNYFENKFGTPFPNKTCSPFQTWYVPRQGTPAFIRLDKNQIWAVDLLWASEGSGVASRFGHAMLRLVICAPGRVPGPSCYEDVDQHLVLSFAAATDQADFSSWDGLTGRYPLNLHAMALATVKVQYTLRESRDLYAVPLKLTGPEKNRLVDELYEQHWNLDADYYFVGENCTSEIVRSLRGAGLDFEILNPLKKNSPRGLFRSLLNSPLALADYDTREKIKKNRALYFSSNKKTLAAALEIAGAVAETSFSNLQEYRQALPNQALDALLAHKTLDKKQRTAFFYLEGLRLQVLAQEQVTAVLKENKKMRQNLGEGLAAGNSVAYNFRFAGSFLTRGQYGLPTEDEIATVEKQMPLAYEKVSMSLQEKFSVLQGNLRKIPKTLLEYQQTQARVQRLSGQLSFLADIF